MRLLVIVVSVLELAISNVAAVDYLVGDEKGWTPNIDYRAWTKDKIFLVGDRLLFKYPAGAQNVVQVKRDAFKNCVADSRSGALTSGNDVVELTRAGRIWFISGVGDHCSVGNQKLGITVFPASFNLQSLDIDPSSLWPLLPFAPWLALLPGFYLPPSPAPAPSSSKVPPGWWKLVFPPSAAPAPSLPLAPAPAPSFGFPWKLFFPPSSAPNASVTPIWPLIPFMPWILFLPGILFPPTPAPAPSLAPAPAPSI